MSITTSSNERHRIQKAIKGATGMEPIDALDEKIDNSKDAKAKKIIMEFEDGYLKRLYNNGKPMDKNDKIKFLQLDSESKTGNINMKGKYGIGNFNSNARIGGKGTIITTSYDGKETVQCVMDFAKLSDPKFSPENAWTGPESRYKPQWDIVENSENYPLGVTQEYSDSSNVLFNLEDIIMNIYNKYDKDIKNDLVFKIIFDSKEYIIDKPVHRDHIESIITDTVQLNVCSMNMCHFNIDSSKFKSRKNDRGSLKCDTIKQKPSEPVISTPVVEISYVDPTKLSIAYNPNKDSPAKIEGYIASEYVNQSALVLFDVKYDEVSDQIILPCGLRIGVKDDTDEDVKSNKKQTNIHKWVAKTYTIFNPELTISCNGDILTTKEFDKKMYMSRGGNMGKKDPLKAFKVNFKYEESENFDLSQEDKSKVNIPDSIKGALGTICYKKNDAIINKLEDEYGKVEAKAKEQARLQSEANPKEEARLQAEAKANKKHKAELDTKAGAKSKQGNKHFNILKSENMTKSTKNIKSSKKELDESREKYIDENEISISNEKLNEEQGTGNKDTLNEKPQAARSKPQFVKKHRRGPVPIKEFRKMVEKYITVCSENENIPNSDVFNTMQKEIDQKLKIKLKNI